MIVLLFPSTGSGPERGHGRRLADELLDSAHAAALTVRVLAVMDGSFAESLVVACQEP
jgi:hypothetical protein